MGNGGLPCQHVKIAVRMTPRKRQKKICTEWKDSTSIIKKRGLSLVNNNAIRLKTTIDIKTIPYYYSKGDVEGETSHNPVVEERIEQYKKLVQQRKPLCKP
jgi:hypothetical protein